MPRLASTPEHRSDVRRKIRQAASDLYKEGGLSAVSARSVAQRADLSVGTLYSYFANLTELMRSLWTTPVADAQTHMAELARQARPAPDRLESILHYYVSFARQNQDIYRAVFLYVRPENAPQSDTPPVGPQGFHDLLRELIREGQRSGDFVDGDADRLAHLMWAGIHGAIALPINFDGLDPGPDERMAEEMIAVLLNSIRV